MSADANNDVVLPSPPATPYHTDGVINNIPITLHTTGGLVLEMGHNNRAVGSNLTEREKHGVDMAALGDSSDGEGIVGGGGSVRPPFGASADGHGRGVHCSPNSSSDNKYSHLWVPRQLSATLTGTSSPVPPPLRSAMFSEETATVRNRIHSRGQ